MVAFILLAQDIQVALPERCGTFLPFVVILIVGGADFFWEIFRFFRPKKWSFSLHGHPVLEMITSSFFIVLQYKPFKNGHRTIGIDAIFSVNNQPARYAFERKPYERGKS